MLVGFVLYAVLQSFGGEWRNWLSIIELFGIPDYWSADILLAVAAYVVMPIPIIGAPACLPMLSRSRMLRYLLLAFAAMGSGSFISLYLATSDFRSAEVLFIAVCPLFTISGLLLIKPVSPALPE